MTKMTLTHPRVQTLTRMLSCLTLGLFAFSSNAHAVVVESFDDVVIRVGSGGNESLLAIDFDGTSTADQSLVWAYRWDTAPTVETLFRDIVSADPRLFTKITNFSSASFTANILNGIGYDNGDGVFALDDGTSFNQFGIFESPFVSDEAASVDPADLYAEGFNTSFFNLSEGTIDSFDNQDWVPFQVGFSDLFLTDQAVYSFAFAPGFAPNAFAANPVAAIPEPSTFAGIVLLAGVGFSRRKRRRMSVRAVR